jgi:hypothetical protein
MNYLIPDNKVRKFFNILYRLDRTCQKQYKGADPLNPDSAWCQQEVFVRRTVDKWFHGKCFKLRQMMETGFWTPMEGLHSNPIKLPQYRYIRINRIAYMLGYGQEIEVRISDATKPVSITEAFSLNHNETLGLMGEEITEEQFKEVENLFNVEE